MRKRSDRRAWALVAGVVAVAMLGSAAPAGAQQRGPRLGVAAPPPQPQPPAGQGVGRPGYYEQQAQGRQPPRDPRYWQPPRDPRYQPTDGWYRRGQHPRGGGTTVVYVPVPAGYGYTYGSGVYPAGVYYGADGYYYGRPYSGVTDANGRPLTESLEPAPDGGVSYTPDLNGSPYRVTDESMMVVDFANGERRAFPSCAHAEQGKDPQGRPRTIFYQPPDYWMVLRPGQRGRVLGQPPADAQACYAVDSIGRMVLRW